ncbi:Starch-binding associating with outer membrane [Ekhidna lutea]|uniref:Starch-binding associating with outer membrane n=1 Tax=Ekhidna lutea TaxID=447679 RepID=A0A239KC27_EKHLU|nr:RagB/SusD family nutrient uptake outer membrane protein [Ekhidna lutea]SNT15179.1 Starch-binding associating with outer membrane [Ekhidna lutea]
MKSYNKLYKIGLALVVILGVSCSDQLEVEPQQSVSTDAAFETLNDFENAVIGLYSGLQDGAYYGRNFPSLMDASSDNGNIPDGAGARLTVYYTLELNPTNTTVSNWTQAYNVIGRANQIINRIDDIEGDQAQKDQLKAEALFVRALCHFDIMRIYAHDYNFTSDQSHLGVPYVTTNEIGTPARDVTSTVFTNIMDDLNTAETLMSNATSAGANRSSTMAVVGLRARVNLYMGDYTNALADANEVINTGGYTLGSYTAGTTIDGDGNTNNVIDEWATGTPRSEDILVIFANNTNDTNYPGLEGLASIYNRVDGYGDLGPSDDIVAQYDPADIRNLWYRNIGGVNFVNKYPGNDGNTRFFNYPVLRLSEMILIQAECLARDGQNTAAQNAINLITARANAPAITSTGNALINDILAERRRELAFEGHRYGDIKRLQMDIDRGSGCTLTNGNCVIPYGDKLFAWPIPQEETDANPNMQQDALWTAFLGG